MFLGDVLEVRSGLVVSRKKAKDENSAKYKYKQLNLRSVSKEGYIIEDELEVLSTDEIISSDYMTVVGDVVVRLTDPYTAIYIDDAYAGLVVSSNFAIIKESKDYNSKFLAFYLNGDTAKKKLYSNMQGSIIKSINLVAIEQLELPLIPKSTQEVYGNLFSAIVAKLQTIEKIRELEIKLQKQLVEQVSKM